MKIVITIKADQWTKENAEYFHDWLQDELLDGNSFTPDDAEMIDFQIVHEEER